MHKLTPAQKGALHINTLSPTVKQYISDLELELDRVTTRQARLRKNIRSMQKKLELVNLLFKFTKVSV